MDVHMVDVLDACDLCCYVYSHLQTTEKCGATPLLLYITLAKARMQTELM